MEGKSEEMDWIFSYTKGTTKSGKNTYISMIEVVYTAKLSFLNLKL